MRKLATIRKISEIKPIEGAGKIELAVLDGWRVIIKKDEYKVNDLVVYLEVDSWVPSELAPFLTPVGKEPKEYNGVKGEKLRTKKLRGELSQGLVLPLSVLGKPEEIFSIGEGCIGADVSEQLNIQKWEPTVPIQLRGLAKGNFPSWVPKTDQTRVQNINLEEYYGEYEVTEKLEGSSCTFYLDLEGNFEVCSRNLSLKETEDNAFWKAARMYNVEQKMKESGMQGFAIQGELVGEGIQGNIYNIKGIDFYVYDVYDVKRSMYLCAEDRQRLASAIGLKHVPVIGNYGIARESTKDKLLHYAEGKSVLNPKQEREGCVLKSINDPSKSFKIISNKYLLKRKE